MIARFFVMLLAIAFSLSALARVNINTANVDELQTLKGIGEARAQAIVDYRNQHGPYRSLKELGNIPRFPDNLIDQLRNQMTVGPLEADERPAPRAAEKAPVRVEATKPAAPARPATPAKPAKPASVSPGMAIERHESAAPPAPARPAMPARPPVAKPAASDAQPPSLQKPVAPAKPAMPAPAKPAVPAAPAKPAVPAAPAASHEHEAAAHDEKPAPARPTIPAPARPAAVH